MGEEATRTEAMERREQVFFYLRVLFLPFLIPMTIFRGWTSSWASLETVHQRQEQRFQRMWGLLPAQVKELVQQGREKDMPDAALRRYALVLVEYQAYQGVLEGWRDSGSKYGYRNALDAANRRLRIAELRQRSALDALKQ